MSLNSSSTSDKQKSLIISILLYAALILILFFIRFWPPANIAELSGGGGGGGMTVNFGDTDAGMGNNFQNEEKVVKNIAKPIPVKETQQEQDVIAEENSKEEGVVIPKNVNVKKVKEVIIKETKPVIKTPVVIKPKVSSNTNDALSSIIKGSKSGDGNTKTQGNQGANNGSLSSGGYGVGGSGGGTGGGTGTGNGTGTGPGSGSGTGGGNGSGNGKGNGSGYALGNRKALSKPKPDSSCSNETGKVVIEVTVDKNGNTINAQSIKGTDIADKCLKDQAKKAAMNTRWEPSPNATGNQVGQITYTFGLN